MARKISTKATHEIKQVNGLNVIVWTKECPVCHTIYKTSARHQKFCSDACCQKFQKKRSKQQREYSKTKEVQRLSARAHALAVETLNLLVAQGLRSKQCECCGSTENLNVHHKDLNWLNNTPSNLQFLCSKCHSAIHSSIESPESLYSEDFLSIISLINKNCQ